MLQTSVLEALAQSPRLLTAGGLLKMLKPQWGRKLKQAEVAEALRDLAQCGRLWSVACNPRKPADLSYASHPQMAVAEEILRAAVTAAKSPVKPAALAKKLPAGLRGLWEPAIKNLLASGRVFKMPKATAELMPRPPRPSDLPDAATTRRLKLLLAQASQLRRTPLPWDAFLQWLDGEPCAAAEAAPPPPAEARLSAAPPQAVPISRELLRQWYDHDRLRSNTRMIPIPRTWEHYQAHAAGTGGSADLQELRSVLQGLYNEAEILLEPCERPQDLPAGEQAMLIPLALGPAGYAWCWA